MFELTKEEKNSLRSQFVTLKKGQHSKYLSSAFTERGVAAEQDEVMFTAKEEEVVANCDHLS